MKKSITILAILALGWMHLACSGNNNGATTHNFDGPTDLIYLPAPDDNPNLAPSRVLTLNPPDGSATLINTETQSVIDASSSSSDPRTRIAGEEGDIAIALVLSGDQQNAYLIVNHFPQAENKPEKNEIDEGASVARAIRIPAELFPTVEKGDRPSNLPTFDAPHSIHAFIMYPQGDAGLAFFRSMQGELNIARWDLASGQWTELGAAPFTPHCAAFRPSTDADLIYLISSDRHNIHILDADRLLADGWDSAYLAEATNPELPASEEGNDPEPRPYYERLIFSTDGNSGWAIDGAAGRLYHLTADAADYPNKLEVAPSPILHPMLAIAATERADKGPPLGLITARRSRYTDYPDTLYAGEGGQLWAFNLDDGGFIDLDTSPYTVQNSNSFIAIDDNPSTVTPSLTVSVTESEKLRTQLWTVVYDDTTDDAEDEESQPDGFRVVGSESGELERWTDPTAPYSLEEHGVALVLEGQRAYMDGEGWSFTIQGSITPLFAGGLESSNLLTIPGDRLYIANRFSDTVGILDLSCIRAKIETPDDLGCFSALLE